MTTTIEPTASRSGGKLQGIEAGRGIASVMVVFYHAANHMKLNIGFAPLGGIAQFGHAGVDFFFVLSGFIIFYVHRKDLGHRDRLGHYAERRFTRIYPLYWFVCLLAFGLVAALGSGAGPKLGFMLEGLALQPTKGEPFLGVAWTLQHELIFYVIFSIAIVNLRVGLFAFAAWLVLIWVRMLSGFPPTDDALSDRLLSFFNIEFFLGMFAAWLAMSGRLRNPMPMLLVGALLFVLVAGAEDLTIVDGYSPMGRLGYGLSSMLVVVGLTAVRPGEGFVGKGFGVLGSASYSIYLTHLTFIGIVYKASEIAGVFRKLPVPLMYLVLSVSGIAGGIVISRLVEYPLMRRVRARFFERPLTANA